jgi:hypothetical protein
MIRGFLELCQAVIAAVKLLNPLACSQKISFPALPMLAAVDTGKVLIL